MGTRRPPARHGGSRTRSGTVASNPMIGARTYRSLVLSVPIRAAHATSQASGIVSVSRVRPMKTATRASAGPVIRCSSARVYASATLM